MAFPKWPVVRTQGSGGVDGPFCLKLETYLRMAEIPYEPVIDATPFRGPKRKLPWIQQEGKTIVDSGAASGFVVVLTANNLAYFLPRILRAASEGRFRRIRGVALPVDTASFLVIVTQLLNALGSGLSRSVTGFLIGLFLLLLTSALNFAFLLYVIGRAHDGVRTQ